MAKKTILKVNMHCQKCKRDILKAVTKLRGIDQVTVDLEKGTLTVIGDVDPVDIVDKLKNIKRVVEIMTVGPPKPLEPKTPVHNAIQYYGNIECQYVPVSHAPYSSGPMCIIL